MKFLLIVVGLSVFSYAFSEDSQCQNDFQTYRSCLKSSLGEGELQTKTQTYQGKASQCFQQAGCNPPDWNADPTNGQKGPYADMPDNVKACVQEQMSTKVASKVDDCLARHGVTDVNWNEWTSSRGSTFDVTHHGGKGVMTSGINAMKTADQCCQQKHGGDTNAMQPLHQCLHVVKQSGRPEVCSKLQSCQVNVPQCKQRADQIRQALCLCAKEKQLQIAPKLRQLGSRQKVAIEVLEGLVTGDQGDQATLGVVDYCYKKYNEPEPFSLQVALRTVNNNNQPQQSGWAGVFQKLEQVGGAAGTESESPSVSGTTCVLLADMITLDANDQSECNSC